MNDVDRATEILRSRFAVQPIYPSTRPGANGTRVNFFLVCACGGKVLIELVETPIAGRSRPSPRRTSDSSLAALFDQLRHQCRPTGLVACAQSCACFAVEIFVKQNQITPVRIFLEKRRVAVDWAPTVAPQKNVREASR